jgi:hypothetical protein
LVHAGDVADEKKRTKPTDAQRLEALAEVLDEAPRVNIMFDEGLSVIMSDKLARRLSAMLHEIAERIADQLEDIAHA